MNILDVVMNDFQRESNVKNLLRFVDESVLAFPMIKCALSGVIDSYDSMSRWAFMSPFSVTTPPFLISSASSTFSMTVVLPVCREPYTTRTLLDRIVLAKRASNSRFMYIARSFADMISIICGCNRKIYK